MDLESSGGVGYSVRSMDVDGSVDPEVQGVVAGSLESLLQSGQVVLGDIGDANDSHAAADDSDLDPSGGAAAVAATAAADASPAAAVAALANAHMRTQTATVRAVAVAPDQLVHHEAVVDLADSPPRAGGAHA